MNRGEQMADAEDLIADGDDRYTENPTDDELLEAEMEHEQGQEGLQKAVGHKYISRRKVKGRYEYTYPDDQKKKRARREAVVHPETKVAWGKLPGGKTSAEHIEIAQEFLGRQKAALPQALAELKELAGPKAKVMGRVKAIESALNKLVEKPKYGTANNLQDGAGLRAIHNTVDEVKATVAKIKQKYKVIEEDDYIENPKGDYRSHHLIIEGPDGLAMEMQIRTQNQNTFADWAHDVYKPLNEAQKRAKDHPDVKVYAKDMSEYYWALDNEQEPPPKPACTKLISDAFGCL